MKKTKLSQVRDAAAAGDWQKAISIAAKFQDLGAEKVAIQRAHSCYTNPRFCVQIGIDMDAAKEAGRLALCSRYSL